VLAVVLPTKFPVTAGVVVKPPVLAVLLAVDKAPVFDVSA
jgi:hypothetical protein